MISSSSDASVFQIASKSSLDGLGDVESRDDIYVCASGKNLETLMCVISLYLDICSFTYIVKMEVWWEKER